MKENDWRELRDSLQTFSFLSTRAQQFHALVLDSLRSTPQENEKLALVTRFLDVDRHVRAQMIQGVRDWKVNTNCDVYRALYRTPYLSKRTNMLCISYLLSHQQQEPSMVEALLGWVRDSEDWEAFDILHRFPWIMNQEQANWLEGWLHTHRYDARPLQGRGLQGLPPRHQGVVQPGFKDIYSDSQNVHDSSINDSVWKSIKVILEEALVDDPEVSVKMNDFYYQMKRLYETDPKIQTALQRIERDRSVFTRENKGVTLRVTLHQLMDRVLGYIYQQPKDTQKELLRRTAEELREMSGLCATGHLSRIVNILVGFHPYISIQITEEKRIRTLFTQLLQKYIMEEKKADELMSELIAPRGLMMSFMETRRKDFLQEISKSSEISEEETTLVLEKVWKEIYPAVERNPFKKVQQQPKTFWQQFRGWLEYFTPRKN
jgi:hypothetical protein